uniref:Protein FAR1-RELATED SEQUENCE n=1 Tax=Triticum urartu TaxID=4572 RepID=A0A8R7UXG7_TRIUA
MLLDNYYLRKHPYMTQIYEICSKWAKSYFKGVFDLRQSHKYTAQRECKAHVQVLHAACKLNAHFREAVHETSVLTVGRKKITRRRGL